MKYAFIGGELGKPTTATPMATSPDGTDFFGSFGSDPMSMNIPLTPEMAEQAWTYMMYSRIAADNKAAVSAKAANDLQYVKTFTLPVHDASGSIVKNEDGTPKMRSATLYQHGLEDKVANSAFMRQNITEMREQAEYKENAGIAFAFTNAALNMTSQIIGNFLQWDVADRKAANEEKAINASKEVALGANDVATLKVQSDERVKMRALEAQENIAATNGHTAIETKRVAGNTAVRMNRDDGIREILEQYDLGTPA